MKTSRVWLTVMLVAQGFLLGCGNSPLWNHEMESSLTAAPSGGSPGSSGSCMLGFEGDVCGSIQLPVPPRRGMNSIVIRFTDRSGNPVEVQGLSVLGSMKEMDMDVEPVTAWTSIGPGVYSGRIHFSMTGFWALEVSISQSSGPTKRKTDDFSVVR